MSLPIAENAVNSDINIKSIEACHTLPVKKPSDKSVTPAIPTIVIRFANRKHKADLLRQGRKLNGSNVYINEHLSKKNANTARKTRSKIKATFTALGQPVVKLL